MERAHAEPMCDDGERVIHFSVQPYIFHPSDVHGLFSWGIGVANRWWHLPLKKRVGRIHVEGAPGPGGAGFAESDRVMVLANHASLTDGSVLLEVLRRRSIHPCFMATYEMFQHPGLLRWSLKRLGAMSIQPYGCDLQGVQEALRVLTRSGPARMKPSLCVFPEGVVYREKDRARQFHVGPFALAIRAAADLRDQGAAMHIQPVSLHVSHRDPDAARRALLARMAEVEALLGLHPAPGMRLQRRVARAGRAYLRDVADELGLDPGPGGMRSGLTRVRDAGTASILAEMGARPRRRPARNASLERAIDRYHELVREGQIPRHTLDAWSRRLMLLKRIDRYDPTHLGRPLTFNQVAGVLETMLEDLTGRLPEPLGDLEVFAAYEPPICVSDGLEGATPSDLVERTRERTRQAINTRLAGWHAQRISPGDHPWHD